MPTRTLFDDPPAQAHSSTSVAAAKAIKPTAAKLREQVYDAIKVSADGLTDEEIQDLLNMGGSTQRPRRRELEQANRIRDSGQTRPTKSGRQATVWRVVG